MGVAPHALYPYLREDFADHISDSSIDYIFRGGQHMWPGISFKEAACQSLYLSLTKKLETGMTKKTQAAALEKFLEVNSACGAWELQFDKFGDDILFGEFCNFLYKFWHPSIYPLVDHDYDCLERGRLGPGSSIGARGGDFYTKFFSSDLTCTNSHLYFLYKRYIRGFPEWSIGESVRATEFGEARVVEGNRLSFVSKNDDISRTICTEPSLNMFYQLGFGEILSTRLNDLFGVNLEVQQFKNRELARRGSLDGSFSTIDLSSASDSISIRMLKACLPKDFLSFLMRYRCPSSRLPNGKLQELNMVSTMGNGYTFPLQTVLFTCVVLAAFQVSGMAPRFPRGRDQGNFGVNGDDIVVPTEITQKVLRLLSILGFSPNPSKTFVEGTFRESCGGDYLDGRNLRGVYLKRTDTDQDLYSAINQLNLFSTRTGILLKRTVSFLVKNVEFLPVPLWENDDAGIKVPFSMIRHLLRNDGPTQSIIYYGYRTTQKHKIRISDSALFIPRCLRRRIYNPSGLLISFLQGSINSSTILPRQKEVRYKRKRLIAPNWELQVSVHSEFYSEWVNWQRWNTSVYLNLYG